MLKSSLAISPRRVSGITLFHPATFTVPALCQALGIQEWVSQFLGGGQICSCKQEQNHVRCWAKPLWGTAVATSDRWSSNRAWLSPALIRPWPKCFSGCNRGCSEILIKTKQLFRSLLHLIGKTFLWVKRHVKFSLWEFCPLQFATSSQWACLWAVTRAGWKG